MKSNGVLQRTFPAFTAKEKKPKENILIKEVTNLGIP
jgi:hypothetical protein